MEEEAQIERNIEILDREHPELDMFSEASDFKLNAEEARLLDQLKMARAERKEETVGAWRREALMRTMQTGKIINHADLLEAPFSRIGVGSLLESDRSIAQGSTVDHTTVEKYRGKILTSDELLVPISSVKLECAKQRRMQRGLEKRIEYAQKGDLGACDEDERRLKRISSSTRRLKQL